MRPGSLFSSIGTGKVFNVFNYAAAYRRLPRERVWFIADPHFFMPEAYLAVFERPYESVGAMHEALQTQWNAVVGEEDLVFVLGDVFMTRDAACFDILRGFRGRKVLIMGNHDENAIEDYLRVFDFVSPSPICMDFMVLSHEPLFNNGKLPFFNIYGHVHNDVNCRDCTESSFCVSVERIGYRPISLAGIIERVAEL